MAEPTMPFITLPNWIKAAAYCGFNIDPIFKRFGIEPDLMHLEDSRIRLSTMNQLMETCVLASREAGRGHHFPFILGETFTFEYLPEMETYINTSSSLRDASRVLKWVHELISPYVDIQLAEEHGVARMNLVYTPVGGVEPDNDMTKTPYVSESFFATLLKFFRMLMGQNTPVRILRFRHPAPDYAGLYETFFHAPVAFNQEHDSLEFDARLLDRPLHGAFPDLHQQAELLVQQRLARQPLLHGTAANLQRLYQGDESLLSENIERMAHRLNMHPRSLQRHLRHEGTSFTDIQTEARLNAAVQTLQHSRESLESISERLGFSDRRSFTRAFKRWTGVSPSQYRRSLQ